MLRTLLFVITFGGLLSAVAAPQSVHIPEKGSAERTQILDALRLPVEKDLKQKIRFVTDNFNVRGNWAFVSGKPQTPAGGGPNYRNTRYWSAFVSDAFDNNFFALLKRNAGRWKVVTTALGCTDVCYTDWWSRYRAPKAIFPYTE